MSWLDRSNPVEQLRAAVVSCERQVNDRRLAASTATIAGVSRGRTA
jgi:hypothetical protein